MKTMTLMVPEGIYEWDEAKAKKWGDAVNILCEIFECGVTICGVDESLGIDQDGKRLISGLHLMTVEEEVS